MKKLIFIGAAMALSQSSFATYDLYSVNVPEDARPQIDKTQITKELKEKKQKGYIEKFNGKYEYLSNIENRAKLATKGSIKSTELVSSTSEIVTASKLKSVPQNAKLNTIGYAPVGNNLYQRNWMDRAN